MLDGLKESADITTEGGLRVALQQIQDAAGELMDVEENTPFSPDKQNVRVVGRVMNLLRRICFGERVAEGPKIRDIPERYIKSLTEATSTPT